MNDPHFTGHPKPDNFDYMVQVWDDPVAFADEVTIYNAQLAADGHPTVYNDRGRWRNSYDN